MSEVFTDRFRFLCLFAFHLTWLTSFFLGFEKTFHCVRLITCSQDTLLKSSESINKRAILAPFWLQNDSRMAEKISEKKYFYKFSIDRKIIILHISIRYNNFSKKSSHALMPQTLAPLSHKCSVGEKYEKTSNGSTSNRSTRS